MLNNLDLRVQIRTTQGGAIFYSPGSNEPLTSKKNYMYNFFVVGLIL